MTQRVKTRCPWAETSDRMRRYHDVEWGVPLYDDRKLFEFLLLDVFQAGLSWAVILNKRDRFRTAFDEFEASKIARYGEKKVADLMSDAGIVRNRPKITAAIVNAQAFLNIQKNERGLAAYLWRFVDNRPIKNKWETMAEVPTHTPLSVKMSRALTGHGFRFTGPTVCYAFMQAAGMVNDHLTTCFRYNQEWTPRLRTLRGK